jgi:glycosyltransferase involved in cell wall biosynthesis
MIQCRPHTIEGADALSTITVVIPFYNVDRYIEKCIQALLAQTYPAELFDVIMVDNNSTDHSAAIVRQYPGIRLVSERKQGAYAARNRGIAEAMGDIIAFTDPDCVPDGDWLKEIDSAMGGAGVRVVVGNHAPASDSFLLRLLEEYEDEKNKYIFGSGIREVYYGYTNNMAVKRTLFADVWPNRGCTTDQHLGTTSGISQYRQ